MPMPREDESRDEVVERFFSVEDGELVEYQRYGECLRCGACCCKHTIRYQMEVHFVGNPDGGAKDQDDDWGAWEGWSIFYAQGCWWYFLVTAIEDAPDRCPNLIGQNECGIWRDPLMFKPICRYWPWNPNDLKRFPDCGFGFERIDNS